MRRAGATLHCGAQASHCGGFSCCRAWALGTQASVVVARELSSCGSRALEHRLSSCGARAGLLRGMRDHPGTGFDPVSPALAGGFLTTVPPGKSLHYFKNKKYIHFLRERKKFKEKHKHMHCSSYTRLDTIFPVYK